MGPVTALRTCIAKSFQFSGRAKRPAFWWFIFVRQLVTFLVTFPFGAAAGSAKSTGKPTEMVIDYSWAVLDTNRTVRWLASPLAVGILLLTCLHTVGIVDSFDMAMLGQVVGFYARQFILLPLLPLLLLLSILSQLCVNSYGPNPHEVPQ